jgi:beta-phosphoglucomutase-like phosphatase (HAD superfamily)
MRMNMETMTIPAKLVVCDLVGTLIRDSDLMTPALLSVLSDHGVFPDEREVISIRGRSKRDAIKQLLHGDDMLAHVVFESFRARLQESFLLNGIQPVDGAEQVCRRLRRAGVRVAVTSGLDKETARALIDALSWEQGLLEVLITADDVPVGRPAPFMIFRAWNPH